MSSLPLPIPADPIAGASGQLDFSIWAKNALIALDLVQPVGAITMYGGTVAPTGWHLCNGTAHGSADLAIVIGNPNTPDLRDKFIVGAGTSYAQGATGGAAAITLTGAQSGLKSHGHTASSGPQDALHTHATPGYAAVVNNVVGTPYVYAATSDAVYGNSATGTEAQAHTHAITVDTVAAADAAASHENRPPYYALTYIIKK